MFAPRVRLVLAVCATSIGCGESSSPGDHGAGGMGGRSVAGAPAMAGNGWAGSGAAGGGGGANAGTAGTPSLAGGSGGARSVGGNAGSAAAIGVAGASTGGRGGAGPGGGGSGAISGATSRAGSAGSAGSGGNAGGATCGAVTAVPETVRSRLGLDAFYRKHIDANGLPVLASDAPADESLILACKLLLNMLGEREDVRQELIRRKARFAIIGKDEGTADIPEYGYRDKSQSDIDYINQRARGLGGIVASCGEENILCLNGDRYRDESICVHEFSHTISLYGTYTADDSFEDDLQDAYDAALASGILDGTYRNSNLQEYWAEGVQDWYDTNASANPSNGVHNQIDTRAELASYDPTLYALVSGMFPEQTQWGDCHADD